MRLLIVGGSDAGISAGLRAKELDKSARVVIMFADRFPNYSICGLPYYISGEIGGGYIGLEMADALTIRGLRVSVVEQLPAVMPTVDSISGRGSAASCCGMESTS